MSSETVCEVSKKLLDLKQRSVIKFLTKEGNKPKEILERMVAVYGDAVLSYYKVKFWSKQFKWGRESIEDDPHTGRPVEATSEEMCHKLESLILADRRMKVSRLAEETGISAGTVWTLFMKPGHVQGQCKMGPKNAESFLEGHSSPVLSRELGAAH